MSDKTLEVRRLDPRGPAFPGELITSGPCRTVFDPGTKIVATVDLAPFDFPESPTRVLIYINGKYAGFATLTPDGFSQEEGAASPWLALSVFD